jgi:hypothetical protein
MISKNEMTLNALGSPATRRRNRPLVCVAAVLAALALAFAAASARPSGTERGSESVRTLETIKIEGEIAVPQVLFITGREFPRFRDGLGSTFLTNARDVARSLEYPARVRVVESRKEEGK